MPPMGQPPAGRIPVSAGFGFTGGLPELGACGGLGLPIDWGCSPSFSPTLAFFGLLPGGRAISFGL